MPSTTLARGNALDTFYIAPSLTPVGVAAYSTATQTFNVPGLLSTDLLVSIGPNVAQVDGISLQQAWCETNGVLSCKFDNRGASTVVPYIGLYNFQVIRPENLPLPATAV